MKKIKSFIHKLKAKSTLSTYQKPLLITILKLLILNLIVIIVASIIAFRLDTNKTYFDGNYFSALITTFKWMISVNSINQYSVNDDLKIMILAIIVIATGMILFSGIIIATVTTAVKAYIDKKSTAKGKIIVENHFVILNYNNKVPDIIYNLMCKNFKHNILILSNYSKEFIETELQSVISTYSQHKKAKAKLIIKEGSPLLRGNLEDISIEKASSIVIMNNEDMKHGDDINISNSDLLSLKIMLALGNYELNDNINIVIETDDDTTASKMEDLGLTINNLKNKNIIPISFNKKIGQIIAQTIITPSLANVYLDLFSYDGDEFYSRDPMEVDEFLKNYTNAIPIIKYDKLYVFCEDEKNINEKREKPYTTSKKLITKEDIKTENFTVFVIGHNKKQSFIVENLKMSGVFYEADFEVKEYSKNESEKLIEDIKNTTGIKKVLILSDDQVSDDSYDANVYVTLIALQTAFPNHQYLPFITELLDSRNINSIRDFNIKNAIISNRIMSLLITQLALNSDSKKFFNSLLVADTEEGGDVFDIKISKVENIFDLNQDLTFDSRSELINVFYNSFEKKCMLLGYIKDNQITYLPEHLDKKELIKLEKDDSLIYIKY
jgi:hypothetical protein